jgi:hypothetical protein
MNSFKVLLLVLILGPAFSLAHGDKIELNMSGVIQNSTTNQPVSGALISLEKNGQTIYSTRSAADGSFNIKFEGPIGRHDQLQVRVSRKGYQINTFPPLDLHKGEVIIDLEPKLPIPILKPVKQGAPLIAI